MKRLFSAHGHYCVLVLLLLASSLWLRPTDAPPQKKHKWSLIVKDFLLIYFVFRGVVKEAYTLGMRAKYPTRSPSFTFEDDDDGILLKPSVVTISSGFKRMIFCQTITASIGVVVVAALHFQDEIRQLGKKDDPNQP